ncbi:MAG: hypothetical protein GY795_45880 [Desulfobacterales bacterium]|nr:hypothetical protein [Desulfobacterales bacterium]
MKLSRLSAIFILFIFILSHSVMADKPVTEVLKNRAKEHWDMKKNKDWDKAYTFFCKQYQSKTSKNDFIRTANLRVLAFKIDKIELAKNKKSADVNVSFDTKMQGFDLKGVKVKEKWIYEEKNWYVCPEPGGFKKMFKK